MRRHEITRRLFAKQLLKLFTFGGLVHFTITCKKTHGMTSPISPEECPGGLPLNDECTPPNNPDKCPGEMPPADECPKDGKRPEDVCNSGLSTADVCVPATSKSELSDQCQTGLPIDDLCPNFKPPLESNGGDDVCPSGGSDTDECPNTGTDEDGDQCPGGYISVDTCEPDGAGITAGDNCSTGTYGLEDDCDGRITDTCTVFPVEDDSCPNGKNVKTGTNGGDDWCNGSIWASDECYTGTDEDDLCFGRGKNGQSDACPSVANASALDICNEISDDYCTTGITGTDECPTGMPTEDECAGGVCSEDICHEYAVGSDECIPQVSESDQEECKTLIVDKCSNHIQDLCSLMVNFDIAE